MKDRIFMALVACAVVHAAAAGPLNPPAGPITPTNKTLAQVEARTPVDASTTPGDALSVFVISQPGSYYLTGDIAGVVGRHGIRVDAAGQVTIDLNGFTLRGVAGAGGGIVGGAAKLRVLNGNVEGWDRGVTGVLTAERLVVTNNQGSGILGVDNAVISGCVVVGNGVIGQYGIETGGGAMVLDCVAKSNGGALGGGGVLVGAGSRVRGCVLAENALNATGSASGYGVATATNCVVSECRVDGNGSNGATGTTGGILASAGTSVAGCALYNNRNFGIASGGEGRIEQNTVGGVRGTTNVAILLAGSAARLDGNLIFGHERGVWAFTGGNTIVRNVVRGNGMNFDVAPGNDLGPVGTASSSTSPWANIAN